ncbi:MAG: hypothetical protein ACR2JJ_03890 [Sphingomicrobium sp.]
MKAATAPMEALLAAELPAGEGWQYEPKWDGFRCLARRDGADVELISKNGKPLGRYFPEVVEILAGLKPKQFLLDGELIIPVGDVLSFDALQLRLHPAESRVRKLAGETPAELMLFDLLSLGSKDLAGRPLSERRSALEKLHSSIDAPGAQAVPGDPRPWHRARLARAGRRSARWSDRQAPRPAVQIRRAGDGEGEAGAHR